MGIWKETASWLVRARKHRHHFAVNLLVVLDTTIMADTSPTPPTATVPSLPSKHFLKLPVLTSERGRYRRYDYTRCARL